VVDYVLTKPKTGVLTPARPPQCALLCLCVGGVVPCHTGRARRKREDAVARSIAATAQQAEASAATQQYAIAARVPQPAWALPGPAQHAALVAARVAAAQAAAHAAELAAALALQPGATAAVELTQAIQTAAAEALVGCAPAHLGARANGTLVTAANAAAASFAVVLMAACYNTETAGRPAALMPPLPYTSTAQLLAAQLPPPPPPPPPDTRLLERAVPAPGGAWGGAVATAPVVGSLTDGSCIFLPGSSSRREPMS
jgi:hypothetical protein